MPDLVYGSGAVEQARIATAAQARQVPALTDPLASLSAGAFGGLAAGGLGDVLERLRTALRTDLAAAGERLAGLERALDATERSMQDTDRRAAASLAPGR